MKQFRWSMYQGMRSIDTGTHTAESEKDVMIHVLVKNAGTTMPDQNYKIIVNGQVITSFGDEFKQTAKSLGWSIFGSFEEMLIRCYPSQQIK